MSNYEEIAQNKIDEFSSQIKQQFEQIGQEVKDQLITDFDKILLDDLDSLKGVLQDLVTSKTNEILNESKNELGKVIEQEFGGSIFGTILNETILPRLFDKSGIFVSSSFVPRFGKSPSQEFLQISKSLARSNSRNG